MKKKLGKKGALEIINAGMISFISFVLIALLVVILISTVQKTSIVCSGENQTSAFIVNGTCYACAPNVSSGNSTYYNASVHMCAESTNPNNTIDVAEYTGAAYNGTKNLALGAQTPPQFAQILVIVVIIVGILGMLAFLGFGAYEKFKR